MEISATGSQPAPSASSAEEEAEEAEEEPEQAEEEPEEDSESPGRSRSRLGTLLRLDDWGPPGSSAGGAAAARRFGFEEAVRILTSEAGRYPPRPLRLADTAGAGVFVEDASRSRRVLGAVDDRWRLAGTAAVPKHNPQVFCRYGTVRAGPMAGGRTLARAMSYQLYHAEGPRHAPGLRLYWADRPDAGRKEEGPLVETEVLVASVPAAPMEPPLTMARAEEVLLGSAPAAELGVRPGQLGGTAPRGQLFLEWPVRRRPQSTRHAVHDPPMNSKTTGTRERRSTYASIDLASRSSAGVASTTQARTSGGTPAAARAPRSSRRRRSARRGCAAHVPSHQLAFALRVASALERLAVNSMCTCLSRGRCGGSTGW